MIRGHRTLGALLVTAAIIVACAAPPAPEAERRAVIVAKQPPAPPPPLPAPSPVPMMTDQMMTRGLVAQASPSVSGFAGGRADMRMAMRPPAYNPELENRENYTSTPTNPVKQVSADPVSTFSIDVDTASYANVRRMLLAGNMPPRDAVRIEEMINYFDYDYALPPSRATPFSSTVAVVPSPWANGKTLLHIGLQGYDIAPAQRPPLNLVLLLDTSGSMGPENRLPLAKKAFRLLVDTLQPRDKVSIVVYAGSAGAVLEPTSDKARINAALDQLQSGGSTAGGEGLALAYTLAERNFDRTAVNRVMIATDGDFNVGITNPSELEGFVARKRETGIYLSVLGFGGGNYNDALMQRLAQKGNGIASYIDTLAEARKVLHDQLQSALLPIADDVKIQVEFNPGRVAEYRLIGYETRMLNREDFNNDRVDAGEIGAGANVTAIYELTAPGGRTLIDPLRYQSARPASAQSGEIGFLRIRWKPPGASQSQLIERPITERDVIAQLSRAPESTRFATAVAAYGQMLRGDPYIDRSYGWDQVIALAQGAKGADPFGWRTEFVQLARAAKTANALRETPREPRPDPRPPVYPPPVR